MTLILTQARFSSDLLETFHLLGVDTLRFSVLDVHKHPEVAQNEPVLVIGSHVERSDLQILEIEVFDFHGLNESTPVVFQSLLPADVVVLLRHVDQVAESLLRLALRLFLAFSGLLFTLLGLKMAKV